MFLIANPEPTQKSAKKTKTTAIKPFAKFHFQLEIKAKIHRDSGEILKLKQDSKAMQSNQVSIFNPKMIIVTNLFDNGKPQSDSLRLIAFLKAVKNT
jgi:hypothetical protein